MARALYVQSYRLKEILERRSQRWIVIQHQDDGGWLARAVATLTYRPSLVGSMAMGTCSLLRHSPAYLSAAR